MKYEELLRIGRTLGAKERETALKALCMDARMGALAALIEEMKEQFADAGSEQKMAEFHGVLAHAGGSRHALRVLEGRLRQYADVKKRGGAETAEGEG